MNSTRTGRLGVPYRKGVNVAVTPHRQPPDAGSPRGSGVVHEAMNTEALPDWLPSGLRGAV